VTSAGWLVAVDLQRVFGDPGSPWAAPRFGEVLPRIRQLADAFGDSVVRTRFVAPAEPARAGTPSSARRRSANGGRSWPASSATAR
jgi:nicotinamidase-related amidase